MNKIDVYFGYLQLNSNENVVQCQREIEFALHGEPMSAHERQRIVLDILARKGMVTVAELCDQLDVSDMTVRRDLSALEDANLLRRIHGGAVANGGRSYEPPFFVRAQEAQTAKETIAELAASMVDEGDSIALDVGTTTLEIARRLTNKQGITVITCSLPIANVLADCVNIRVIITGGVLRATEHSMIGDIAEESIRRFHVDKVFIGAGGIDAEAGVTEYNIDDARVKRSLLQSGQRRFVVADSSKIDRVVFASVAPLTEIDALITDSGISSDQISKIEMQNVQCYIASKPRESGG